VQLGEGSLAHTISPEKFQGELHLPRCGRSAVNGSGRAGDSRGCEDNQVWRVEVGAIEQVEYFRAELQVEAFGDRSVFEHGEIPGSKTWPGVCVSSDIAVEAKRGWRPDECVRIEPLRRLAKNYRAREIRIQERWTGLRVSPLFEGL
jgi:hypothetical protein